VFALLLSLSVAHAEGILGVDFVPFGRADQAWVSEDQLSGTQVAETDGLLQPPVTAWAGWVGRRDALLGGLALARVSTTVQTNNKAEHSARMGIRPSVDYRRYLSDRAAGSACGYLTAGMYGVVPAAQERSDSASKAEQKVLEEQSRQDRSRIGAVGAKAGIGAEIQWDHGLVLGARYSVVYHRSRALDEETLTVSSLLRAEAALVLAFIL